jgi:two-component system cell cycle response regulator DivK
MPIPKELEEARKKKILIVDSDAGFLSSASAMIEDIPDTETKTTSSGFDAGFLTAEWLPDLILLDFSLPGLNVFEVTGKIKENPRLKKIPVIAVTATGDPGELEKIKKSRVDSVISKPIERASFIKKINRFLYLP